MTEKEMLEFYLKINDNNDLLNESFINGKFILETFGLKINISKQEQLEIQEAIDKLYQIKKGEIRLSNEKVNYYQNKFDKYNITRTHELAHFYQFIALPNIQVTRLAIFKLLEIECLMMIDYFENNEECFSIKEYSSFNKLMKQFIKNKNRKIKLADLALEGIIKSLDYYYNQQYKKMQYIREKEISIFYIIESMAHIISLLVSDINQFDNRKLHKKYSNPYYIFLEGVTNHQELGSKWKYLIFIYICYFSLQHTDKVGENIEPLPIKIFQYLCLRTDKYLDALKELKQRYLKYSYEELKELDRWDLSEEEKDNSSKVQLLNIYSFFELIEIIDNELNFIKNYRRTNLVKKDLEELYLIAERMNLDLENKYYLAKLLIFPSNFENLFDLYRKFMYSKQVENKFKNYEKTYFYNMFMELKKIFLLHQGTEMKCCDKLGCSNIDEILMCKKMESIAVWFNGVTGKDISKIFSR